MSDKDGLNDSRILDKPIHYTTEEYDALYDRILKLFADKPNALILDLLNNLLVDVAMKTGNADQVMDAVRAALHFKKLGEQNA